MRPIARWSLGTGLLFATALGAQETSTPANRLPERLTDSAFWALVDSISEPGGYFQIEDNFTSNEREIGQLFSMLRERGTRGGVYMGVGPEQNLTYIAAVRPQMAFICGHPAPGGDAAPHLTRSSCTARS